MKMNIIETLKKNKKNVKFSMTALIGAVAMYGGVSYNAHAMKLKDYRAISYRAISLVFPVCKNNLENELVKRGQRLWSQERYDDALSFIERAVAEFGSSDTIRTLIELYDWYSCNNRDLPSESDWRAAAMGILGECYESGEGVPRDMSKAFKLYQRAANLGNARAMFDLGVCYENGVGVEKDPQRAVALYQKAADMGNNNAMHNLGVCYHCGKGVPKNMSKAVELYKIAVGKGNVLSMFNLGWCYANGVEVEKDPKKAVEFYQRAAERGFAPAQSALKVLEKWAKTRTKRNRPDSITVTKQSTTTTANPSEKRMSDVSGQYSADSAAVGPAVKKNRPNSEIAEVLAFGQENTHNIQSNVEKSSECKQNRKQPSQKKEIQKNSSDFELYQKAAEIGDADAMYALGNIYARGQGVEQSFSQAEYWYKRAADLGNKEAQVSLENLDEVTENESTEEE